MILSKPILYFLLDENVPDSVLDVLRQAGHSAVPLRESGIQRGSPDTIVYAQAAIWEKILISFDKDMVYLNRGKGKIPQFKTLSLIKLSCREINAAQRVKDALSLIEFEWEISKNLDKRRIDIEIQNNGIKSNR